MKVIGRIDQKVKLNKLEGENDDILEIEGVIFGLKVKIILVYFDCSKNKSGDEFDHNRNMEREIRKMIENNKSEGLIILGDFNAHLYMLEDRKEDANGDMILELVEDYDLTLLNADERCEGVFTWQARGQKSAIDMILVNRKVFEYCSKIVIDEKGEESNFSDHNMFTVDLNLRERGSVRFDRVENRVKWEKRVRIRTDKDSMDKFIELLKIRWQDHM